MAVSIRQIHPHFVGEVSGLDLRKPLTPDEAREVEAAMDRYAVLVFHDQDIDDEQQLRFAANFGPRENRAGGTVTRSEGRRGSSPSLRRSRLTAASTARSKASSALPLVRSSSISRDSTRPARSARA